MIDYDYMRNMLLSYLWKTKYSLNFDETMVKGLFEDVRIIWSNLLFENWEIRVITSKYEYFISSQGIKRVDINQYISYNKDVMDMILFYFSQINSKPIDLTKVEKIVKSLDNKKVKRRLKD